MTGRLSRNIKNLIFSLLILIGFSSAGFAFQKKITVNENIYKSVVGGGAAGTDYVIVDDLVNFDKFKSGDTVLIIQMKGLQIDVPELSSYGTPHNSLGSPGKYEFMIIESTDIPAIKLKFKNNLTNNYDIKGDVQIIRVPSYNSAVVDATVTCPPWDSISKVGGVLTMIVGKTLTLNADIDVSGKGFAGGAIELGDGTCADPDPANLQKYAYPSSFTNSGFKGEGAVSQAWIDAVTQIPIYPAYAKGKGANFNGGGGGNGRFSGGGGGSNRGAGGKGGRENNDICTIPVDGGLGGKQTIPALAGGIYLGGGGGGSTFSGAGTSSTGGKGGGIVIIICNDIEGNGHIITADGATTTNPASGTAGAGGGGAGGSIALYLESFSTATNLTLSAKGAKGGNNAGTFGEGGGGGGGFIWINNISVPGNVTPSYTGGIRGTNTGTISAGSGAIGEYQTTFTPILNGFLFNSIRSTGTFDQTDSICSDQIPYQVTGTKPVGGSGSYTYLWQRKNDSGGLPVDIPSLNTQNFTFTAPETDTFFIRRIVKDESTLLTDTSKWVEIRVQSFIKNNNIVIESDFIGPADSICYNGDPKLIRQLLPDLTDGNPKYYLFDWQDSTSGSAWMSNGGTLKDYDPLPDLLKTTWYRRKVTSGRCIDKTAIVKVTVLDTIKNNIITSPAEEICNGMLFTNLTATTSTTLAGGDNTYRYKWESNINGVGWGTATGVSNGAGYDPVELLQRVPSNEYYYRRVIYSGMHDVCVNTSSPVLLKDWPVINNNIISADQTICSGSIPAIITGPEPSNGAGPGTFTYTWQDSSKVHNWSNIAGFVSVPGPNYSPPALTDTTSYRRIASSSACSNISNSVIKRVHKPIANNNIFLSVSNRDTTICSGAIPGLLKGTVAKGGTDFPGDYAFLWYYSLDKLTWTGIASGGTGINYQPGALTLTTYYKRRVTSGLCTSESDTVTITVLPLISNNFISTDQTVCYNTIPAQLTGPVLTGGAGGTPTWLWQESPDGLTWSAATGTSNNQQNYSPPSLTVPMKYRRIIFSGPVNCCIDTSNVIMIGIDQLSSVAVAGPDKDLYTFDNVDTLHALKPVVGTGAWSVLVGTGTISSDSIVSNLSGGENKFEWTVTNGACVSKDQVVITVHDLKIPEGFSPNNDMINDEFIIQGLDLAYNEATLRILNSAGTEVFFTSNTNGNTWINWKGENGNGILPEGTYYYILTIKSKRNNNILTTSGFIVLKRINSQ